MAKENPDTVILGGVDERQYEEGIVDGTVTPGDLIIRAGSQDVGAVTEEQVVRSDADGAKIVPRVAIEEQRGGVGRSLDDDYQDGDECSYVVAEPGDEFYMFVFGGSNAAGTSTDTSDNANISDGESLVAYSGSGQGGTLRALDTGDGDTQGAVLFEAQEGVDNSSSSSPARIKVKKV